MRVDPEALVGWADCPSPSHHYDAGWMAGFLGAAQAVLGRRSGEEHSSTSPAPAPCCCSPPSACSRTRTSCRRLEGEVRALDVPGLSHLQTVIAQRLSAQQQR